MKTTNKEFTKSDRPQSGFYNVLLQRIYSKVDGINVSKIDRVVEVLTISQLKSLAVDVSKYGIKNDQGLACRFENTRNYCFPVDAMINLLSKEDHATFKANYDRACKELEKQIAEEKKASDPVRKAVLDVVLNATVKAAEVIPLNAAKTESVKAEKVSEKKTEKTLDIKKSKKVLETVLTPDVKAQIWQEVKAEKAEEKKQENKPVEELTVSKSVTVDSAYIENLIAAAPVAKKSKGKKATVKKSDLEQIAALF